MRREFLSPAAPSVATGPSRLQKTGPTREGQPGSVCGAAPGVVGSAPVTLSARLGRSFSVRLVTWYELWLFLHIAGAIVWIGAAATIQVFGILTKRAADPAKTSFFAQNVSFTIMRILLPAALLVIASGIGLTVDGNWDWGEPFITIGLVLWAVVALIAFGFLGRAIGRAGAELAAAGPSPAIALRMRNLVWLSRGLLAVLAVIVFLMVVKPGS